MVLLHCSSVLWLFHHYDLGMLVKDNKLCIRKTLNVSLAMTIKTSVNLVDVYRWLSALPKMSLSNFITSKKNSKYTLLF